LTPDSVVKGIFEFVLLIFSLSVHECAHAWMASRLGDQTARLQGRITLNPMYHIDPIGTLLIPGIAIFGSMFGMGMFLIGWAKPTPVITRNFRKIVRDDVLTTLAGPVSNLLLVVASFVAQALMIRFSGGIPDQSTLGMNLNALFMLARLCVYVNLVLFFFNLLPFPPLDGSRILRHFLPYSMLGAYDSMGMFSYILMIFVGGFVVRMLMTPSMGLIDWALASFQAG
jgi:Zn-dependent protease